MQYWKENRSATIDLSVGNRHWPEEEEQQIKMDAGNNGNVSRKTTKTKGHFFKMSAIIFFSFFFF